MQVLEAKMVSVMILARIESRLTAVASALAVPAGLESDHVRLAIIEGLPMPIRTQFVDPAIHKVVLLSEWLTE